MTEHHTDNGRPLERLRQICQSFPEVAERPSHGAPTWFVRDKKAFATFWVNGHHQRDFPHLWLATQPGTQEALIAADPQLFFRPAYVGHLGWVGVRMDGALDWQELAELCDEAYRRVAPKTLVRQLDDERGPGSTAASP